MAKVGDGTYKATNLETGRTGKVVIKDGKTDKSQTKVDPKGSGKK